MELGAWETDFAVGGSVKSLGLLLAASWLALFSMPLSAHEMTIAEMELRGLPIDHALLQRRRTEFTKKVEVLRAYLEFRTSLRSC
jgi:hypothetical protein